MVQIIFARNTDVPNVDADIPENAAIISIISTNLLTMMNVVPSVEAVG